jgi:hypothetical protein
VTGTLNMALYTLVSTVVSTLNDHLDEMIAANTEIKTHYAGVLDGTAAGGGSVIFIED